MGRKHDAFSDIIIACAVLFINFIKRTYKAGRLIELLISFPILIGAYILCWHYYNEAYWWVLFIPISVFSVYWWFLFQNEKITSVLANPRWVDRRWWRTLDGWEFEEEVAKVFRLNGYKVKVTQKTSDGGIDLLMYKGEKKAIVQCKHYTAPVGVSVARELNGLKEDFRANELILVASSGVTEACMKFIKNKPYFKILNLEDIIRMGLRPFELS